MRLTGSKSNSRTSATAEDEDLSATCAASPEEVFAMMIPSGRTTATFIAVLSAIATFGVAAHAQQSPYPKQTQLPNSYRLVEGWPTLPKSMNGGQWGEVIRADIDPKGNIWVF